MRSTSILLVVVAGLVACSNVAAATSKSAPKTISEAAELDAATLSRKLTANDDSGRFLRAQADDSDSLDPDKKGSDDEDKEGEDRDLIIPALNEWKYRRWFRAHLTPHDVKEVLGLNGLWSLVEPIDSSIYKGYIVYYEEHCRRPEYSSMRFCQPGAEE